MQCNIINIDRILRWKVVQAAEYSKFSTPYMEINMELKKKLCRLLLLAAVPVGISIATPNASALGIVSRSCLPAGAQESITVDWGFNYYWLWTASSHYRNGAWLHNVNTTSNAGSTGGWEYTWRSYAGHLGTEYWYGQVTGYHYKKIGGVVSFMGNSWATDCNLSQWGGG
jgi:hypothetical protein